MGTFRISSISIGIIIALVLIYGLWLEPGRLIIKRNTIYSNKCKNIKILLLSDLHLPSQHKGGRKIIRKISDENPDLILIAGDLRGHGHDLGASQMFLNTISMYWKVVVVLGDKDLCGRWGQCLYCSNRYSAGSAQKPLYTILRNQTLIDSALNIAVYGVDDPVANFDNMRFAKHPDPSKFNILLIHSTHKLRKQDIQKFDLVTAGNTHGGQIFFLRPILQLHGEEIDNRFIGGSYIIGKSMVIVSQGIGTSYIPMRLGVPPEMTVIDIQHKP